ncbi:Putative signal transducing protein [Tistlia consotensis]|uniref:Putative signal transducing protein n=1 Tax=Tistlia consotensis USBA 355 TaxID=560819 RepID=A0A1Y6B3H7_9PROT|nr:DUF2007 domain-containing protein [Tistlia consotensis]SME89591.1 Putative signal transducing protein [Tistlia consotensis USBA 355]SNR26095.1 Putative signal transducing protein [Tistlia consotensis]
MKEVLRTTDPVKISWFKALLKDAGIEALELDLHTSVLEGSAFAIPRRLAVADSDFERARRALESAGEELSGGGGFFG